jgi:hypothetical protein
MLFGEKRDRPYGKKDQYQPPQHQGQGLGDWVGQRSQLSDHCQPFGNTKALRP